MNKPELDSRLLKAGLLRRLPRRSSAKGELKFAAAPALTDEYLTRLSETFAALGRPLSDEQRAHFRVLLERKLTEAFAASPYASILIRYETDPLPKTSLSYKIAVRISTLADEYADWVANRAPPLFGSYPDQKVMDLARSLGAPAEVPVLDIGAGTGRNTLPLARAGYPTDALELSPDLARILRADLEKEALAVRVVEGDVTSPELALEPGRYRLIIACEVVSHFRDATQLRALLERCSGLLAPGGLFVFSGFLAGGGFKPDRLARELSQVFWCTLFTRDDLKEAAEGLPLDRVSDEPVLQYEQERLPKEAWPPTGWFVEWTQGMDLFDLPGEKVPIDMRWIVYRRR